MPTRHAQVIGEDAEGTADVSHAPYLQAVVLETLRLRPPAYIVGRCAARAVRLGAFSLPAGALVAPSEVLHFYPVCLCCDCGAFWTAPSL